MQRLEPVIVQEKGLAYSPKGAVTTKWEFSKFDFGSAMKPKSFESDMILVQPHHNYEPYLKEFYDTYKILAPTVLERTGLIPSDLVPEVLAVSVTGALSIIGMVLALLVFTSSAVVFLAPLLASASAAVFLWRTIRSRCQ